MLTTKALRPRTEPSGALRPPIGTSQSATSPKTVPPPAFVALREPVQDTLERQNHLRRLAFFAGLGFVFIRITDLSNVLVILTGINLYLLYIVSPLAILGTLTTGGIGRTLRQNAARYWVAFFLWMVLATPFSAWRGDSVALIASYSRFQIAMLFVLAGLAMSWAEIRLIFYTLAAASVTSLGITRILGKLDEGGRLSLKADGSIGNSNDLGALLLLLTPFLLYVILDRKRMMFFRMALLPFVAYSIWVVLGTGSRGCLIAMVAMFLFGIVRASSSQRAAILVAAAVLALTIPLLLPSGAVSRLGSVFKEKSMVGSGTETEAAESSASREYLLKQSIAYTVQHPLFGVGPGQFAIYEGRERTAEGKQGSWHVTHNFLTQVSSECGIPAMIFMLLGIGSAFMLVNRAYRKAQAKGFGDIVNACLCFQLAMVGYLVAIIFLAHAYNFYLPMMVGLAIALSANAMREMAGRDPSALPFAAR